MDIQSRESGKPRVALVIPAGRRRYLAVLIPQILRQPGWDELQLWCNTSDEQDLNYIRSLTTLDARIRAITPPERPPNGNETIGQFFRFCTDRDTVYVRFDDDICWIEESLIARLAAFRRSNPQYFLVAPLIVNNAICTYLLQVLGFISPKNFYITASCMDDVAWRNPPFSEMLHREFLHLIGTGAPSQWKFSPRPLAINRFSINCISWLGEEFAKFSGRVPFGKDEEEWLSVIKPAQLGVANCIWGEGIVAHFAFHPQRAHLDRTDILQRYAAAAGIALAECA